MSHKDEAQAKIPSWYRVFDQMRADPNAVVQCPFCQGGPLSVTETPTKAAARTRRIGCDDCHEETTLIEFPRLPDWISN